MEPLHYFKQEIDEHIKKLATPEKSLSAQRYFPDTENFIGINAGDILTVIKEFDEKNKNLNTEQLLQLVEYLLAKAQYSEEVLIAFGLLNKYVKKHYGPELLARFQFWLENYSTNWSHVDDLCIKTIYRYMLARPDMITLTATWAASPVNWCRRASCVVWVKFIERKIGKNVYRLDKELIFQHCKSLIEDEDEFVQKSIGWLLKVSARLYEKEVIDFIWENRYSMKRATMRYAIEKMDKETRARVLRF